jgi:hypothetical protein
MIKMTTIEEETEQDNKLLRLKAGITNRKSDCKKVCQRTLEKPMQEAPDFLK